MRTFVRARLLGARGLPLTLTKIAGGADGPGTSLVVTTTAGAAVGESIIIMVVCENQAPTSITDDAGNTYVDRIGSGLLRIYDCLAPATLASSSSITLTTASNSAAIVAVKCSRPVRFVGKNTASGTSASPSVSLPNPAGAGMALFGCIGGPASSVTITQPAGWTSDFNTSIVNSEAAAAHKVASAANQSYAPTLSASSSYTAAIAAYA